MIALCGSDRVCTWPDPMFVILVDREHVRLIGVGAHGLLQLAPTILLFGEMFSAAVPISVEGYDPPRVRAGAMSTTS